MTSEAPLSAEVQKAPPETFEEFLASSRIGYIYADPNGKIIRVSARISEWLATSSADLSGTNISDHLAVTGKVYFQTHLIPLLKMQGFFEEAVMELAPANLPRIPVIVNGIERTDVNGAPEFIRLALLPTIERSRYERNLRSLRSKAEGDLTEERETAALREQFIAVLGHDLRNPLAAIDGGVRLLRKTPLNDRASNIADMMQLSVARMASLIDDVMDLARGRLGGGITISRARTDLVPTLAHAVNELKIAAPSREITAHFELPEPIDCDPKRIAQLLSNLIANALTHGASEGAICVKATTADGPFELSVSNHGDPIPPDALKRLFQPFTREDIRPSQQGLGLGLYIASEIAKAHNGTLSVISTADETRFTLQIPLR